VDKVFFTSDQHFFHDNIRRYCGRPFKDITEMHREIMGRWNGVVGPRDTVYCLGDFAFQSKARYGAVSDILKTLNGKKILIKGNHDKGMGIMKQLGFDEVHLEAEYNGIPLIHVPRPSWKLTLCGHIHEHWVTSGKFLINVGVDVWNFTPVTLEQLTAVKAQGETFLCRFCGKEIAKVVEDRPHRTGTCMGPDFHCAWCRPLGTDERMKSSGMCTFHRLDESVRAGFANDEDRVMFKRMMVEGTK